MYLSTMMLTGQGGPDGDLPWYTSGVVLLTGVFSIGMFAIPASMLTWGFEAEAERYAKRAYLREKPPTKPLTMMLGRFRARIIRRTKNTERLSPAMMGKSRTRKVEVPE
jgi:hypothetical protein